MEDLNSLLRRLDTLHRADLILHGSEDPDLLLEQFLQLIMGSAEVDSGTLYLVDAERKELIFSVVRGPSKVIPRLQGQRMPADQGIVGRCVRRGEAIWVPDVEHSPEWARDLAKRALKFKHEKGRLPSITAVDPWEKRMAEGIAFLQRKVKEGGANG